MNVKLDWLSFSLWHDECPLENDKHAIRSAFNILCDRVGEGPDEFFIHQQWETGPGRKPYSVSMRNSDNGIAIFANPKLPHFLIELSGKGCERMMRSPHAQAVIEAAADRVTRIDLACDILTDTDPRAFVAEREQGRFKSGSEMVSESGITCYVGSRTSQRYARVYRYSQPHPRAHLLRVEHVFKGEDARSSLAYLVENGYDLAAAQAARMFGWKHAAWDIAAASENELQAHRNERGEAKTIYWLYETVAPVLARLHREGILELGKFLEEAVFPRIDPEE